MFAILRVFDFFARDRQKPIPKVYLEPRGARPNHDDFTVNPLLIKGLYGD